MSLQEIYPGNPSPASLYVLPDSDPTEQEIKLKDLRFRLGIATCEWMRKINERVEEVQNKVKENPTWLETGIWYPHSHLRALDLLLNKTPHAPDLKKLLDMVDGYIVGFVNPKFFDINSLDKEPLNKRYMNFPIRDGVLPSIALKAAITGLSLIEDNVACQLSRY